MRTVCTPDDTVNIIYQSYLRANSEACHDFSELLSFVPQCCRGSSERTDRFHPHVSPAKCSSYQVESGQSNVQRLKFVQNLLNHGKSYRCMWKEVCGSTIWISILSLDAFFVPVFFF